MGIKVGDHWKSKSPSVTFGEGAIVSGNSGRGVVVDKAYFRMTDGSEISYNMGGGVSVYSQITSFIMGGGTFIMDDGTISGNKAKTKNGGGGVYVTTDANFTINGGTVSGNTVDYTEGSTSYNNVPNNVEGTYTNNGGTVETP